MTPSASLLLLLLLLGLSEAFPVEEEGSPEEEEGEEEGEEDTADMTTRILSTNSGSNEILLEGDVLTTTTRNANKCSDSQSCLWEKANGVVTVPYVVSYEFSQDQKNIIKKAMKAFENTTCIRFKKRSNEDDFISIENQNGCYSYVGKIGGRQMLSLRKTGCLYHGIIIHELNHALGFWHEQNRSDRDSYVRINWHNIYPAMTYNFHMHDTNNLNTYDYYSIMHYGRTAFSINGSETITPIPKANTQIGQRQGLSLGDIQKLKLLYGC